MAPRGESRQELNPDLLTAALGKRSKTTYNTKHQKTTPTGNVQLQKAIVISGYRLLGSR